MHPQVQAKYHTYIAQIELYWVSVVPALRPYLVVAVREGPRMIVRNSTGSLL